MQFLLKGMKEGEGGGLVPPCPGSTTDTVHYSSTCVCTGINFPSLALFGYCLVCANVK